ncbi:MAG: hypothetical protein FGM24_07320 [Candidatus Kapabacteria bacterium]|nr:hypothetical protein [Candidatus Kapabacteria bacterium]
MTKANGTRAVSRQGLAGQTRSILMGAMLVMLGTGGFAVARDAGTLPPAVIGMVLMTLGWLGRRGMTRLLLGIGVAVAGVGMLGTAAYVPAVLRLLGGQDLPHPTRIGVLAATGVLCIAYVTMGVRSLVRTESTDS